MGVKRKLLSVAHLEASVSAVKLTAAFLKQILTDGKGMQSMEKLCC